MEDPINMLNNEEVKEVNPMPNQFDASVPSKISTWTKIKNFLFQDIVVELTPKQEEVFNSVHNFWHQEVDETKVKGFLFQKISFK